jgi:hypothetical protein
LIRDGYVLAEISKGIYGLKQAGILAQQKLVQHLAAHDFPPISDETPCIFRHKTKDVMFCLVVDDFGVKYKEKEDASGLLEVLRMEYAVKDDWSGCSYVGFRIKHDQDEGTMTLTMPKYISDAAERFGIDTTRKIDNPLSTGCIGKDSTTPATPQQQKRLQQIIGVLLYYARAIDSTVLTRISRLSTQQKDPTVATLMAAENAPVSGHTARSVLSVPQERHETDLLLRRLLFE